MKVHDKATIFKFMQRFRSALLQYPYMGPGHNSTKLETVEDLSWPRSTRNSDFWGNHICTRCFETFDGFDSSSSEFAEGSKGCEMINRAHKRVFHVLASDQVTTFTKAVTLSQKPGESYPEYKTCVDKTFKDFGLIVDQILQPLMMALLYLKGLLGPMLAVILSVYKTGIRAKIETLTVESISLLVQNEYEHNQNLKALTTTDIDLEPGPSAQAAGGLGLDSKLPPGRPPDANGAMPKHVQLFIWMSKIPDATLGAKWKKSAAGNGHCTICFVKEPHTVYECPLLSVISQSDFDKIKSSNKNKADLLKVRPELKALKNASGKSSGDAGGQLAALPASADTAAAQDDDDAFDTWSEQGVSAASAVPSVLPPSHHPSRQFQYDSASQAFPADSTVVSVCDPVISVAVCDFPSMSKIKDGGLGQPYSTNSSTPNSSSLPVSFSSTDPKLASVSRSSRSIDPPSSVEAGRAAN